MIEWIHVHYWMAFILALVAITAVCDAIARIGRAIFLRGRDCECEHRRAEKPEKEEKKGGAA